MVPVYARVSMNVSLTNIAMVGILLASANADLPTAACPSTAVDHLAPLPWPLQPLMHYDINLPRDRWEQVAVGEYRPRFSISSTFGDQHPRRQSNNV